MDEARRRRPSPRRPGAAMPLLLLLAAASSFARAEGRTWPWAAVIGSPGPVPAPGPGTALGAGAGASMTELQKHVAFFDRDYNGILTIDETYEGLKAIGMGKADAKAAAAAINGLLAPKTRPDKSNSSRMDIYLVNIVKGIHRSDTDAFDPEGRFVPAKLDEMFTKYGKTRPNAMTEAEIGTMLKANRGYKDFKGWISAKSEWNLLYKLGKGGDGFLSKDTARAVYDGTLFYQLFYRLAAKDKMG